MRPTDEMAALTGRTQALIDTIAGALVSSAEVAAERIALAAEAARVTQRMSAFAAVLDAVGAQKAALAARIAGAEGAMRTLLERQVELLTMQEVAVLEKAGVGGPTARAALEALDVTAGTEPAGTHRRDGRRFVRIAAGTEPAEANGSASPNGDARGGTDGS